MKPLSKQQIEDRLQQLEGWEYTDNALQTAFEFENFKEAFTMMTRIAFEAERLQHHPDWSNVYNRLHIALSTHDAGGVTEKDFELAGLIDKLLG
jgi:4a-hydroxytetrahydrobiopterin dehydratase